MIDQNPENVKKNSVSFYLGIRQMYLSGTIQDLEQRLHQLPDGTGDLQSYYEEAQSFDAGIYSKEKWDKEFSKKEWIFGWTGYTGLS